MNQTRDNPILESILIAIICTLIIVGLNNLPIVNFLIYLIPVSMVVLAKRRGRLFAFLSLGITGAILGIMDIYLGLFIIIMYGSIIISVPYVLDEKLDLAEGIAICSGAAFIAIIMGLKSVSLMVGEDIFTYTWEGIRRTFANNDEIVLKILETYKSIGILDNAINNIQLGELVIDQLKLWTPAILAISAIIYGGANLLISQRVLRRYNIPVHDIPKFHMWKLPRGTTRGFFLIMILSYIGAAMDINNFAIVNATVSILFTFIFLIQGLAVFKFLLMRSKIPPFFHYIILIIMALLLKTPLIFMGILDQVLSLRGIGRRPKKDIE